MVVQLTFLSAFLGAFAATTLLTILPWRVWLLRYGARRCPQGHRMAPLTLGPNTAFKGQRKCSECTYAVYS